MALPANGSSANGVPSTNGYWTNPKPHPDVGKPNIWALLKALKRRWLAALVVGSVLGAIGATVVWLLSPTPRQTVRSLIHVSAARPQIQLPGDVNFDLFQRTQAFLIRSRFVLSRALNHPDLKNKHVSLIEDHVDPAQALERELQVDFAISPEIMKVSMRTDKPDEAVLLINAVVKTYLEEFLDKEHSRRDDLLKECQTELAKIDSNVSEKKNTIRELRRQSGTQGGKNFQEQRLFLDLHITKAKSELVDSQFKIVHLETKLKLLLGEQGLFSGFAFPLYDSMPLPFNLTVGRLLQHHLSKVKVQPANPVADVVEEILNNEPSIKALRDEETDISRTISAHLRVSPDPNGPEPAVVTSLRQQLKTVRQKLETEKARQRPLYESAVRGQPNTNQPTGVVQLRNDLSFNTDLQKRLQAEVAAWEKLRDSVNIAHVDLTELDDELKEWQPFQQDLRKRIKLLVFEQRSAPRVTTLEDAVVYAPDTSRSRLVTMMVAFLGGLGLSGLAFGWWEFRTQRVNEPDDVVRALGLSLVGTLPDFSYRLRAKGAAAEQVDSMLSDSVDAVRTMVMFMAKTEGLRTVMVTSAIAGEGKTSSSSHLAVSLARAGKKTLLIDCDIRNPVAHRLFNLPRAPGFSEALRSEVEVEEILNATGQDNLFMVSAGQGDIQAVNQLAQERIDEIFKQLKAQFDFIVVDSSPVLPVPDSLLIAQHVDAVIFSTLRDVSRLPKVFAAYQRLSMLGIRILGAIVNGAREDTYSRAGYAYVVKQGK